MEIVLKNVKFASFMSRETLCFSATVYVDGVRAFLASNDGGGGPDRYEPLSQEGEKLIAAAEAYAKTLPPVKISLREDGPTLPMSLEVLIGDLLKAWDENRQIKKWSKKATLFRIPGDKPGEYRTVNSVYSPEVEAWIKAKYPEATVYNPASL